MKKQTILIILLTTIVFAVYSQSQIQEIVSEIEKNNTTLKALRQQMEADKLSNKSGIYLENPEIDFNYLWGSILRTGNDFGFGVYQSFDFPSVYTNRTKIARLQNQNLELQYQAEKIPILFDATKACINLIFVNALFEEYQKRLTQAQKIATTYAEKLKSGKATVIENNKAQLNLIAVENEISKLETQRITIILDLENMNDDHKIEIATTTFPKTLLPIDFENWYDFIEAKNPTLNYINGNILIGQKSIKLNQSLNAPKFSAGYLSEKSGDGWMHGLVVGMSIPLWENKNQIKTAKAQTFASELLLEDSKSNFKGYLKNVYLTALNLEKNSLKYQSGLTEFNNTVLLHNALESGEMSLLEYLREIEYYYQTFTNILESQRSFELTAAELLMFE